MENFIFCAVKVKKTEGLKSNKKMWRCVSRQ